MSGFLLPKWKKKNPLPSKGFNPLTNKQQLPPYLWLSSMLKIRMLLIFHDSLYFPFLLACIADYVRDQEVPFADHLFFTLSLMVCNSYAYECAKTFCKPKVGDSPCPKRLKSKVFPCKSYYTQTSLALARAVTLWKNFWAILGHLICNTGYRQMDVLQHRPTQYPGKSQHTLQNNISRQQNAPLEMHPLNGITLFPGNIAEVWDTCRKISILCV